MIIKNIKKIKKICVSYSGGLDTSVAIKWMFDKGIKIFAYYANIDNVKNKKLKEIKNKALKYGAYKFKMFNLKKKIAKEAIKVIKYNAFNVFSGKEKYYNTTPISRFVITKKFIKEMKKDNINIWSDGSTYKGNDIERFYLYSLKINKKIRIYKPWLDKNFIKEVGGGRKEMIKYLKKKNILYSKEKKNYSIDSNILGNTYEGENLENLNSYLSKKHFEYKKKYKNKICSITFKKGVPVMYNNKKIKNIVNFVIGINKIAGGYSIGISDQIENRILGIKSRGVYESPFMELMSILYERLANCVHNEECLNLYRENSYKLGIILYKGMWLSNEAIMIKSMLNVFSKRINGKIKFTFEKNKVKILSTYSKFSLYNKKNISMEKVKNENFNYKDRIGYLNIKKLSLN
ncbi:argininosuccinate synthase [Candidatus Vidania fulgoroideae]|nr:argininosuccinate synthase [Candidatus Vidania fulgoroideae]WDR79228.1 argininosuccinate synthase [Candidatus Vidania fulgoroideae]